MKIVVVEDHEVTAKLYAYVLELQGHQVDVVTYGFGALFAPYRWEGVDVAIVDLHLSPSVSGSEILYFLETECPHVRRIAITGRDRSVEGTAADAFLMKPIEVDDLFAALEA